MLIYYLSLKFTKGLLTQNILKNHFNVTNELFLLKFKKIVYNFQNILTNF